MLCTIQNEGIPGDARCHKSFGGGQFSAAVEMSDTGCSGLAFLSSNS